MTELNKYGEIQDRTEEQKGDIVVCGHCEGKGVCTRSRKGDSCGSCREASNINIGYIGEVVLKCNVCNGVGKVKVK